MLKLSDITKKLSFALAAIALPTAGIIAQNVEEKSGNLKTFAANLQPAEWILVGVALVLFLVILSMGNMLKRLAYDKYQSHLKSGTNVLVMLIVGGVALFGLPVNMLAEEVVATPFAAAEASNETTLTMMILLAVIAIEIIIILMLLRSIKMFMGQGLAIESAASIAAGSSIWATLWKQMNQSVEIEKEKDILLDHSYDGIRELDNDLPPWWKWGFYITIVFAVIYLARYHVFQTAPLQIEEFEIAMARAEAELEARRALGTQINEETVTFLGSESDLAAGKEIYTVNCAVCHGQMGEGGIGPNMTDDYWIHGGSIRDIFRITRNGVIEKGMTPWRDILSPLQIAQVSSFVKTMRDTDPPNQKAPEGELWFPEEVEEETEEDEEVEGMIGMIDGTDHLDNGGEGEEPPEENEAEE